jgi:hypothetical protein
MPGDIPYALRAFRQVYPSLSQLFFVRLPLTGRRWEGNARKLTPPKTFISLVKYPQEYLFQTFYNR